MATSEEEFFAKLMVTFREEAKEHLKALSNGILELEKDLPHQVYIETVESVFREAHSLKGAARSVNQQHIQEICQSLENVLAALKQKHIQTSKSFFDILHATVDLLNNAVESKLERAQVDQIVQQLTEIPNLKTKESNSIPHTSAKQETVEAKTPPAESEQKQVDKTIRVSLQKLNLLFQEVEETLTIKLLLNQQLSELQHILTNFRSQEKRFATLISTQVLGKGQQQSKITLSLLDEHQQALKLTRDQLGKIIKNLDQNTHYVNAMVDGLIENAKKILMQPTSTLFEAIPLMVREISRSLSKEVHVEMRGGEIEIDRRILEELKDPITHLIRNAIDHGIELPQERIKNNKPPCGTIKITCSESEGNHVKIALTDDGAGINLERIKQSALQKKIISEEEAKTLTKEKLLRLAFNSDISTSPIITEISGRGLGLGIVLEKVDNLGGHVDIDTAPNQGTTFTLTLPLTLATFRGVQISVADQEFIIPTNHIKKVSRIKTNDIKKTEGKDTIIFDNKPLSFVHLTNILGIKETNKKNDPDKTSLFVLIIAAGEQSIAFGVDYVHRECEILVKALGSNCLRLKNVMASTIMEKGNIIPVLNPNDLIKSALREGTSTASSSSRIKTTQLSKKMILLAEDSITTRLLLKNILSAAAYEVITAVDGLDAFEKLQTQKVDLIMTDIEMPRMNGFELTEKIRSMGKFKDVPIIMCTALGSREDRERGIELGASAYLDKNSFNQQTLLNIVQKLI